MNIEKFWLLVLICLFNNTTPKDIKDKKSTTTHNNYFNWTDEFEYNRKSNENEKNQLLSYCMVCAFFIRIQSQYSTHLSSVVNAVSGKLTTDWDIWCVFCVGFDSRCFLLFVSFLVVLVVFMWYSVLIQYASWFHCRYWTWSEHRLKYQNLIVVGSEHKHF